MSDTAHPAPVTSVRRKPDIFGGATHGKVGMWFFLVTDAFTFSGFLLGYGILRSKMPDWPVPSHYLGIALSSIATFLLICSSVTMVLAQNEGEQRNSKKMLRYLLLTALGGAIFLSIQAYEYTHLAHHSGMTFANFLHGPPQFASSFFIITGFHGFHVFSGVVYLLIIAARTALGKYDNGNVNEVEICGLFWHFVDLVWILVFTLIYLI
ncbi:MAG: cytochrome c oxidase subunit 3 [Bdellovibrionales bacterium]|nr:cytochrome c oxidase subunit 3 [Bdellovibrionales bacterium]